MFPALGYDNFYSIVGEGYLESSKNLKKRKNRTPNFLSFDRSGGSEFFQLLYKAKEILEAGGIIHIRFPVHRKNHDNLQSLIRSRAALFQKA